MNQVESAFSGEKPAGQAAAQSDAAVQTDATAQTGAAARIAAQTDADAQAGMQLQSPHARSTARGTRCALNPRAQRHERTPTDRAWCVGDTRVLLQARVSRGGSRAGWVTAEYAVLYCCVD